MTIKEQVKRKTLIKFHNGELAELSVIDLQSKSSPCFSFSSISSFIARKTRNICNAFLWGVRMLAWSLWLLLVILAFFLHLMDLCSTSVANRSLRTTWNILKFSWWAIGAVMGIGPYVLRLGWTLLAALMCSLGSKLKSYSSTAYIIISAKASSFFGFRRAFITPSQVLTKNMEATHYELSDGVEIQVDELEECVRCAPVAVFFIISLLKLLITDAELALNLDQWKLLVNLETAEPFNKLVAIEKTAVVLYNISRTDVRKKIISHLQYSRERFKNSSSSSSFPPQ